MNQCVNNSQHPIPQCAMSALQWKTTIQFWLFISLNNYGAIKTNLSLLSKTLPLSNHLSHSPATHHHNCTSSPLQSLALVQQGSTTSESIARKCLASALWKTSAGQVQSYTSFFSLDGKPPHRHHHLAETFLNLSTCKSTQLVVWLLAVKTGICIVCGNHYDWNSSTLCCWKFILVYRSVTQT